MIVNTKYKKTHLENGYSLELKKNQGILNLIYVILFQKEEKTLIIAFYQFMKIYLANKLISRMKMMAVADRDGNCNLSKTPNTHKKLIFIKMML